MASGPCVATLADKVAALSDPASYPETPAAVEAIETHFAWVFLTGRHAYKLKKPLRLKGADLRSLAARERNCNEELRVNRRLAAGTYLRVAPLTLSDGRLQVEGQGTVQDWLVVMRELPRGHMLDRRLAAGTVGPPEVARVVDVLAGFYRGLPPEPLQPEAYLAMLRARLAEAVNELARPEFGLPCAEVRGLRGELASACEHFAGELALRAVMGHVVEAHGDLRAEHVWLGPPVQVIDALEFDRELRLLDTAEDIAMLVVDMARLGFGHAAKALAQDYLRTMPDPISPGLLAFYESLRAATRAKVAIWHLDDAGRYPDPAPWRRRTLDFVELARRRISETV